MKLLETGSVPIADIEIGNRVRPLNEAKAQGLAEIFKSTEQLHPITLMLVGNQHRLVAGRHRIRAFEINGRPFIKAEIYQPETDNPEAEIRLYETVENLARGDLNALDRAAHVTELMAALHKIHGETRGRPSKEKSAIVAPFSLSNEIADKMGLSKRTIFADAELFSGLSERSRKSIAGTKLADNRAQLVLLSKEKPEDQKALLAILLADEPKATSMAAAKALHFNKVDLTTPDEKAFAKFVKLWNGSSQSAQKQMRLYIEQASQK
jgi:ParB family transcriptional regulator, chromosome partitioning protein